MMTCPSFDSPKAPLSITHAEFNVQRERYRKQYVELVTGQSGRHHRCAGHVSMADRSWSARLQSRESVERQSPVGFDRRV